MLISFSDRICVCNPDSGVRFNQRSTMLSFLYNGSLNWAFSGDAQWFSELFARKGHHLLLSSGISAST